MRLEFPPVNRDFLFDFQNKVADIGGPTGTGKTFTLGNKLLLAASIQRPFRKIRRTHFLIARPSEGEVKDSLVKDLEDEILADIKDSGGVVKFTGQYPIRGEIRFRLPDETEVYCEITARGFEDPEATRRKLKSKKYTCAFIPEKQTFTSEQVVKTIYNRIDRFPTAKDGGIYWDLPMSDGTFKTFVGGRMWGDFNYTDRRHWFYDYAVKSNIEKEDGSKLRKIYEQPPILLPVPDPKSPFTYKGERVKWEKNLEAELYTLSKVLLDHNGDPIRYSGYDHWFDQVEQLNGDDAEIDEVIIGNWGYRTDGRPVFPEFSLKHHVSHSKLQPNRSSPVYVGVDGGFNNAWVFGQVGFNGVLQITDEINNVGEKAKPVAQALDEDVIPLLQNRYFGCDVLFICDESMFYGDGNTGHDAKRLFKQRGLSARAAPTQNPHDRMKAGHHFLKLREGIVISVNLIFLVAALAGGFNLKLNKTSGMHNDVPAKNEHSHIGDAFGYLCSYILKGFSTYRSSNTSARPGNIIYGNRR